MNRILLQIARAHSQDMWTRAFFDHVNPDGKSPFNRMADAGYGYSKAGENIAAGGAHTPEQLENNLMIDSTITGRGHRVNLLDCSATYPALFREVGIGCYSGAYTKLISGYNLKDFLTQDFGRPSSGGPFLVGVVHDDSLGTTPSFYDIGEGLADVRITPKTGTHFTRTGVAGGYAIPVGTGGSLEVMASGSALGGVIVKTVTLGAENVKQDFRKGEAVSTDGDADGMPDAWETFFGVTDPAADADGDGYTNLQEYQGNTDPTLATSYPGSDGGSVTPPPSGGGGGGGGGCFVSHVGGAAPDALAALALGLLALFASRLQGKSAR